MLGKYRHYKTEKIYEVLGLARHSETKEEMVIYIGLYQCASFGDYPLWVRPKMMFFEQVEHLGKTVPRFQWI